MEAQLVAVDSEGNIQDAYVLDVSWRSIKESFLSPRGREMMANDLTDETNTIGVGDQLIITAREMLKPLRYYEFIMG